LTRNELNYGDYPNQNLEDKINNAAGQALEMAGSTALWSLHLGTYAARKAVQARQSFETNRRLASERGWLAGIAVADLALTSAKRIFTPKEPPVDPARLDQLQVPEEQRPILEALARDPRPIVVDRNAGNLMHSIDREMTRKEEFPGDPRARYYRFVDRVAETTSLSVEQAEHAAGLPEPQRILGQYDQSPS
jgi:hypothetical protein